jgi:hypothetical protein
LRLSKYHLVQLLKNGQAKGERIMKMRRVLVAVIGGVAGIVLALEAHAQMNQAPQLVISDTPILFSAGGAAVDIAPAGTVSDSDTLGFGDGMMTVTVTAGSSAFDKLFIRNDGTGPGQVGVAGSNVTYGGTVVATWSGGGMDGSTEGSAPLVIDFNSNCSVNEVQAILRALIFWCDGPPDANQRLGKIVLTDGEGGRNDRPTDIFVNEFHYDNIGTDTGEFMEIAVGSGYLSGGGTLTGTTLTLYNGNDGTTYGTHTLNTFTAGDTVDGYTLYTFLFPVNGIQNGAPDGFALDLNGTPIPGRFQSYEGTFMATNGPWAGQFSVDIGVDENLPPPDGSSLGLSGTADGYDGFAWTAFDSPGTGRGATVGQANHGQTFRIPNTFILAHEAALTLAVDPVASGTTVPAAGTYTVGVGVSTLIHAVNEVGYIFVNWSVAAGDATFDDANAVTTYVVVNGPAGATVTANFAPPVMLTMVADPLAGGGTLPAPGPHTVGQGVPIPIEAMAAPGYLFLGWEGSANVLLGDADAITTTATLSGTATVTANFAEAAELTIVAAANGSTTPAAGVYTVAQGVPQDIVATPDEGHHFVEWLVSLNANLDDAGAATTTVTLSGDAVITPVFAINIYTVVFQTDGTEGATVNGAQAVTYTLSHGSDCTPVTAQPPAGQEFTGWRGDAVGMDNPLTLTNVVGDMTVTASFGKWVAQGLVIKLVADDVDGLTTPGTFFRKPKFYALYTDPVKRTPGKKASLKVLTKIDKNAGAGTLDCEWTKKIKLYSSKDFKAAQKVGEEAAEWLAAEGNQANLLLDLHSSTKESAPVDQPIYGASLAAPEILTTTLGSAEGISVVTIEGMWFGTKKPKVSREYTDAKTLVTVKQQKYKVLKASDPAMVDGKGKMIYMDRDTGKSKVVVPVLTKAPAGDPTGDLVLDNGVGLAVGPDPTAAP